MLLWFYFLLLINVNCADGFQPKDRKEICKDAAIQNVFRAFSDKHSTLIINSDDSSLRTSQLFCVSDFPVVINREELTDHHTESQFHRHFSISNSEIVLSSAGFLYNTIFPHVKECKPRKRVLAILSDFSSVDVPKIFRDSHEKFDLTRFYIADYADLVDGSEKVTILTYDLVAVGGPRIRSFTITANSTHELRQFDEKRYEDWNGSNMRVQFYAFSYTAKINSRTNDLATMGYSDGEIIKIFAKKFNFTIKLVEEHNKGLGWGYRLANGTFLGSLGMVEYNRTDIAANGKAVINYGTKNIDFLHPSRFSGYVFTIPRRNWNDMSVISMYFSCFDYKFYMALVVLKTIASLALYAIDKVQNTNPVDPFANSMTITSISFSVSTKLSKKWAPRWVLGSFMLTFLVVSNLFAGTMVEFFNKANKFEASIRSIEELLESGMDIRVTESMAMVFDEIDYDTAPRMHVMLHQILQKTLTAIKAGDSSAFVMKNLDKLISEKKSAVLLPHMTVEELLAQYGDEMTYIKTPAYVYYIAASIRKQLPMLDEFNTLQLFINAAGIPEYQLKLALNDRDMKFIARTKEGRNVDTGPQPFTIQQTSIIFIFHAILNLIAVLVFLLEVAIARARKGRKNAT